MKRLAAIHAEPDWRRRHKLIENQHPGIGTPLEPFFAECSTALELAKVKDGPAVDMAKEMLAAIGLRLAVNIQAGKWWHLFTLGHAVPALGVTHASDRPATAIKYAPPWCSYSACFRNRSAELRRPCYREPETASRHGQRKLAPHRSTCRKGNGICT